MKRITMKQAIFCRLYEDRARAEVKSATPFIPVWALIGEYQLKYLGRNVFVSHEAPARMSELFSENPNLFERQWIQGKSGARYYGYRINPSATEAHIVDEKIKDIFKSLRKAIDDYNVMLANGTC